MLMRLSFLIAALRKMIYIVDTSVNKVVLGNVFLQPLKETKFKKILWIIQSSHTHMIANIRKLIIRALLVDSKNSIIQMILI